MPAYWGERIRTMRSVAVMAVVLSIRASSAQDATAPGKTAGEAQTKDAVVTFFSGGSAWKTLLPATNNAVFDGCIYDGHEQVGCITFRGFLSVRMQPGAHVFSASLSGRHNAKNSQTAVLLESGKSYFVRAELEKPKLQTLPVPVSSMAAVPVPVHWDKGRLDIVSCEVAHQETAKARPMPERNVGKGFKALVLDDMPDCDASAAKAP